MLINKEGKYGMWYVYFEHLATGKQKFIANYSTAKEAVHKIASCYAIDKKNCMEDEYYYFMRKH